MANQFIIRPAPGQRFEAFVRYVVGLAEGTRVETDTSSSPYFVRVDEGTYRRWVAALPKKATAPAPAAEPEPEPEAPAGAASQDAQEPAPAAEAPAEAAPVREPEPEPEPPKPVAKRTKARTSGTRKRSTGGN